MAPRQQVLQRGADAAQRAGERQRGQHQRLGLADARVGGQQPLLGLAQVGPALEQFRRQAGGQGGRQGQLRRGRRAAPPARGPAAAPARSPRRRSGAAAPAAAPAWRRAAPRTAAPRRQRRCRPHCAAASGAASRPAARRWLRCGPAPRAGPPRRSAARPRRPPARPARRRARPRWPPGRPAAASVPRRMRPQRSISQFSSPASRKLELKRVAGQAGDGRGVAAPRATFGSAPRAMTTPAPAPRGCAPRRAAGRGRRPGPLRSAPAAPGR